MPDDKSVLTMKTIDGNYNYIRLPNNDICGTIVINEKTNQSLHVYVNGNAEGFNKKMNTPIDEEIVMNKRFVFITDKKLLGILHYLFLKSMPNRKFKITDTAKILSLVDNAILLRTGLPAKYEIDKAKWENIKDSIDEAILTKELKISPAQSSALPIQVE